MCYLVPSKDLTVSDETDSASHVRVVISGLIGDELEVLLTTVVDVDHAALGCSGSRISEERVDKVGVVVTFKKIVTNITYVMLHVLSYHMLCVDNKLSKLFVNIVKHTCTTII